ncbi:MAG: phosphoribosyltransferase [Flavobacteriaceae bacterium]|nr:phosphoribosyltransferase [Flavobacteriaceae bacterium]
MSSVDFLQNFDEQTREHVLQLCKKLSDTEADVFILMARKATCFFDCLKSLNLVNFSGYVTSERILDMDSSWLKNKKVCIVDDSIISGTTIYRTIKILNSLEVKEISIQVIATNLKWFREDLFNEFRQDSKSILKAPYLELEDEECIRLCKTIVEAISISPRPYDVDFPYAVNLKLKKRNLNGY